MKKNIIALIIVFFVVCFFPLLIIVCNYACRNDKLYNEIIEVFSAFDNKTDIGKIYLDSCISFYDHKLYIENLPHKGNDEEEMICAVNKELYFGTAETVGFGQFGIHIYKCDYNGENTTEVFSKKGFDTNPSFYYSDYTKGIIYVQSHEKTMYNDYILDRYEIETGEYENVGKGVGFYEYIESLSGEKARRAEIKGKITEDMLAATEEGRALMKYKHSEPEAYFLNDRIFIGYNVTINSIGFSNECLDATFEYNEDNNELRYYCYNILGDDARIKYIYLD